jgi:glycosyltransferase involved in cell wall biosynthesis
LVSIIVSWRDRKELSQALPELVSSAEITQGDLTLVNFGGDTNLLSTQLTGYEGRLRVVTVAAQQYFNKSCAHNLGIANTRNPFLFFCDCDIILNPPVILALMRRLQDEKGKFATLAGVRESSLNSRGGKHIACFGYELRMRTADGRSLRIVDNEEDAVDGTRQAPGLLMVRRPDILSINGYNSKLVGWGWEDQDMISRLTLGAGLERISEGTVVHISHDDQARVAYHPIADRWASRDRMFRQALANYDHANFRGTYQEDCLRLLHSQVEDIA